MIRGDEIWASREIESEQVTNNTFDRTRKLANRNVRAVNAWNNLMASKGSCRRSGMIVARLLFLIYDPNARLPRLAFRNEALLRAV